ncbi:MAG: hypothetical protein QG637_412, partial [Chloroflexota bacterium]|nr:hypothetical protein [Chloroflexota bacterium]
MSERAAMVQPVAASAPLRAPAAPAPGVANDPVPATQVRFDETIARSTTVTIVDGNDARAQLASLLLRQLGAGMGFDASRVDLRIDAAAAARINARGGQALQENWAIDLHPGRFDPSSESGRFLLAHEAAHVAQRHVAGARASSRAAEREADFVGRSFAMDGRVVRPVIALPDLGAAAFDGSEFDPAAFRELVLENHSHEIDLMRTALSYGAFDWAVSDTDVTDVLRILEAYPYPVQTAMVAALGAPYDARLADN